MPKYLSISGAAVAAAMLVTGYAPPAAAQTRVTSEWFAGTWADQPNCSGLVHFLRDGRFFTPAGGEGRWRLEGSTLVLRPLNGTNERRMPVVRLDQNRLRSGEVISYRCEGRSG